MSKKNGRNESSEVHPGSDVTPDEWEFLQAMERYQRRTGRRYPSWREVLVVFESLGYRRVSPPCPPTVSARAPRPEGRPCP